jgi:hypothetical protein
MSRTSWALPIVPLLFAPAALASSTFVNPVFNVSGGAATGNSSSNAILDSVVMGSRTVDPALRVAVESVTGFNTNAGPGVIRIVSGTSTTGTSGFHRLESQDGNASSVSSADRNAFNARIRDAFNNANLNNYLDISDSKSFSFTINFARPIADEAGIAELFYFERGTGGSNSYLVLQPVNASGNAIGNALLVRPSLTRNLSPEIEVQTFNSSGSPNGKQEITGAAIDIQGAFGLSSLQFLRVTNASVGSNGLTGLKSGEDKAPDFKILAIPSPGAGAVAMGAVLLAARRRRA